MWQTFVFASDRRSPIGASTVATSSRRASACAWVPATSTTKSSAYAASVVMPRPLRDPCVDGDPGCWARHNPGSGLWWSEAAEVVEQFVGGSVAAAGATGCGESGQGVLFDGHVGVEIDLGDFGGLVTEPERDHRQVDAGVQ